VQQPPTVSWCSSCAF